MLSHFLNWDSETRWLAWPLGLVTVFVVFALYHRTTYDTRWSHHSFGDAQTLMAAENYRREGFWKLHFLWLPSGPSVATPFLDEDPVRHHAHGTKSHRLYTHWPSWYAVPFGVFAKLGFYGKSYYQAFALTLSLLGMFFLFLILEHIGGRLFAAIGTVLYLCSPSFWAHSDSLANMPCDELFRFATIYAWILWRTRGESSWRLVLACLCYFLAALTSLDSVFFTPVVCGLYDLFFMKRIDFKHWFVLAASGLGAFGVQFAQNATYLGAAVAWNDWTDQLLGYGGGGVLNNISKVEGMMIPAFNLPLSEIYLTLAVGLVLSFRSSIGVFKWYLIFYLAGGMFALMVPGKAGGARHMFPLAVFCYSVGLTSVLIGWRALNLPRWFSRFVGVLLVIGLTGFSVARFHHFDWPFFKRHLDIPAAPKVVMELKEVLEEVSQSFSGELVVFHLGDIFPKWGGPEYPQVDPLYEYYSGTLLLSFDTPERLAPDINFFWNKTAASFTPVILFRPSQFLEEEVVAHLDQIYASHHKKVVSITDDIVAIGLVPNFVAIQQPENSAGIL